VKQLKGEDGGKPIYIGRQKADKSLLKVDSKESSFTSSGESLS